MDFVRFSAVKIIFSVTEKNSFANVEIAKILREKNFSDLDRRFLTELVYGTLKKISSIDWIIEKFSDRKIDKKVLAVLRLGVFQILFTDKIPKFAAVNESVEIAKKFCGLGASKFVNGILRSILRNPEKIKFPDDDSVESLALKNFHPIWIVKLFLNEFGLDETKKILAANNLEPPLCLRVNTLKISREEFLEKFPAAEKSKLVDDGIILKNHGALDNFLPLKKGLCQVQDESSMLIAHLLEPQENNFVIDCCAAPGGKSTHIAELMKNRGKILACDIYEHKIKKISENAKRLGIKIIEPILTDARKIGEKFFEKADRVLVDVPCSGLGVLRRKSDLRLKKNFDEIKKLPTLQLEILESAAKTLKRGGILIYSTCTILKAENENVVEKFLSANKNFELVEKKLFLPHIDNTDGFFYAKILKN